MSNLTLKRYKHGETGIFGVLTLGDPSFMLHTLEHAFNILGLWNPTIPPGTYTCVRGLHKLHNMSDPFVTFEILGVPDHTGLLFHWGNWNKDSEGCVLLGTGCSGDEIVNSKIAFGQFMDALLGVNSFQLEVLG